MQKYLQTTPFAILMLNLSNSSANFYQVGESQTKKFGFFSSSFFFLLSSSSVLLCITQKLYGVCEYSAQQPIALLVEIIPTSFDLRVSYGLITFFKTFSYLVCTLLVFSRNNCGGMTRMVRPHQDY